jgi:fructose-bisphosphate aldolase class II
MSLMSLADILRPCVHQDWAVGAYDTPTLDTTQAIVDAALADDAPVIFMLYPSHVCLDRWATLAALIRAEVERTDIPAALILDHGLTFEQIKHSVELGFGGVMIDASKAPVEDNIAITRRVVQLAHSHGIAVEAELGHVGSGMEELSDDEWRARYTRVEDAQRFVEETGIDALAISIGTAHGLYRIKPHLDLERLAEIRQRVQIPLVLHGSSDTPEDEVRQAVQIGIDKVNVWTDMRIPYLQAMKDALSVPVESIEVCEVAEAGRLAASRVVQQKNRMFGSVGKAKLYRQKPARERL